VAVRDYYRLTKPGIVKGNLLHTLAGSIFAAGYGLTWQPLIGVLLGTSFIIASACVLNNYIDRDIDARMARTRSRPSVTGTVTLRDALIFAAGLFAFGLALLLWLTNLLVVVIGLVAYVFYVLIYAVAKRHTVHSTLIGAIPGALPAMAGYVAISTALDPAAWLLFALVLAWQMPHFYAISIFRRSEYAAAKLPVLGVVRGFRAVRRQMGIYMAAYLAVIVLMLASGVIGWIGGGMLLVGALYWAWIFLRPVDDPIGWARRVFVVSLLLTVLLLVAVLLDALVKGIPTV